MDSPKDWTEDDVAQALDRVRAALLGFLRERTRLDWFKHKVWWRLSRRYIWPGAPEGAREIVEEKVLRDAGVSALVEHLRRRQREISDAIERYNTAVQRLMERQRGVPAAEFDEASRLELNQRRITFQGTREELLRRARGLTEESGPELFPDLLCLRLAILTEDVRENIFHEVSARVADEVSLDRPMSRSVRDTLAATTEIRLRCLDRYHVARLLAENYSEARRLMDLDGLLERCRLLAAPASASSTDQDAARRELRGAIGQAAHRSVEYLEELYPATRGTHDRELRALGARAGASMAG